MFRKFLQGLLFGSGFAVAFIALLYLAGQLFFPVSISVPLPTVGEPVSHDAPASIKEHLDAFADFHELGLDEQIRQASVIAVARYETGADGRTRAIITEFLKREPGTVIFYDIGDEHPSSSFVAKQDTRYGDGTVIFFTGSPAQMRMSMSYYGERIASLADMPLALLRNKCEETR